MEQPVSRLLRDHALHNHKHPTTLAGTTLRYRSEAGLGLLSAIASQGRLGYDALLQEIRDLLASDSFRSDLPLDVLGLTGVARVMAGTPRAGTDYTESADLHQAVRRLVAAGALPAGQKLPKDFDRLDAQTNLAAGRVEYVSDILADLSLDDDSRWMLETELAHPRFGRANATEDDWLRAFNRLFEPHRLTPIMIRSGTGAPFDRIDSAVTPSPVVGVDLPLVTIVMSAFRPGPSLFTSLRSLAAQTWPALQVLVVDDCSPPEYQQILEEAVALDSRFELHRMPENGGTYKIRNFAMARARGEFIAFQDSDDWSHPERIERQMAPLLAERELLGTTSRAVRVDEQLGASKIGFGALRQNASSLLFRREPVLTVLGGYDEVRKAADSEFTRRLDMAFGDGRVAELVLPLALVQLTRGSLSRLDFQFGWHHGNRVLYREAYEFWHTRIAAKECAPRLDPSEPRPFAAPAPYVGKTVDPDRRCDVLLVSDWRRELSRYGGAAEEARAMVAAGLRTAVVHAEAMRFAQRRRVRPDALTMHLRESGEVLVARWDDPLAADVAVISDPELLCYPRASAGGVRVGRVAVVAGYPTRAPDGDLVFDPAVVEHNVRELLDAELVWQPATPEVATSLLDDGAGSPILPPQQVGVALVHPRAHAGPRGGRRPVIGTSGLVPSPRDHPGDDALLTMFPDDDRYDVRIRDAGDALNLVKKPRRLPPNWLVTRTDELGDFLSELDFYVGVPVHSWGPYRSHEATTALARGCVAILDPSLEPYFGDAAVYCDARAAIDIVDQLFADPVAYAAQQQRGYDWCRRVMSPQAYGEVLARMTSSPPTTDPRSEESYS